VVHGNEYRIEDRLELLKSKVAIQSREGRGRGRRVKSFRGKLLGESICLSAVEPGEIHSDFLVSTAVEPPTHSRQTPQ
jgi:hypothetical protein